jgi:ribosomal protein S27E
MLEGVDQGRNYGKLQWCDHCDDMERHLYGLCLAHNPLHIVLADVKIKCRDCGNETAIIDTDGFMGRSRYCKACLLKRRKGYSCTVRAFMVRMYSRMRSRCRRTGGRKRDRSYRGLPVLKRDLFYEMALSSPSLKALVEQYIAAGRPIRLAPSIDRIDPTKGYLPDNIQFLTMIDNARKGKKRPSTFRNL